MLLSCEPRTKCQREREGTELLWQDMFSSRTVLSNFWAFTMCRFLPLLLLVLLLGCQGDQPKNPREPNSGDLEPYLPKPSDFAKWPKVTEEPVSVTPQALEMCRAAVPRWREGPHTDATIVVRVSPEAADAFRDGKTMPVGAQVVKEKYTDAKATGPMNSYAVMTKRQAGYDPTWGDWEYAMVYLDKPKETEQGRLGECARCHAQVREKDYLFRSYIR